MFCRYLNFCLDILAIRKNGLIRKIKLISNFMTSQPGKKTIAIHILPNISRSKCNQIMEFDQLIEYNIKTFFLEESYLKRVREINHDWAYLWVNSLKFCTVCFYFMPSWGLSKYIETNFQTTSLPYTKLFKKTKKGLELVTLAHFLHDFWRKIFPLLYSITNQISLFGCNICIVIVC